LQKKSEFDLTQKIGRRGYSEAADSVVRQAPFAVLKFLVTECGKCLSCLVVVIFSTDDCYVSQGLVLLAGRRVLNGFVGSVIRYLSSFLLP